MNRLFRPCRFLASAAAPLLLALTATPSALSERALTLATTTSTENSGLLDHLLPAFETRCECVVRVIPVGTGKALRIASAGDADAVLVHSPPDEKAFVADGHGIDHTPVMHNDFILLGPAGDPAGTAEKGGILDALALIAAAHAPFVSRGDDSGTHRKELHLWSLLEDSGDVKVRSPEWYIETGSSMGQALLIADQKRAYVLSDRGTYLFFQDKVELSAVVDDEGDPLLYNPYSAIAVNPERHPHVEYELARAFIDWLGSSEAHGLINGYRVHGRQLFHAD